MGPRFPTCAADCSGALVNLGPWRAEGLDIQIRRNPCNLHLGKQESARFSETPTTSGGLQGTCSKPVASDTCDGLPGRGACAITENHGCVLLGKLFKGILTPEASRDPRWSISNGRFGTRKTAICAHFEVPIFLGQL